MNKLEAQLQLWDSWLKEGHGSKVRQCCRKLNHKLIPRDLLIEYGHIARRVGAPDLIVRWLRPYVRSEKGLLIQPRNEEKALYALGLFRLGAFREAAQLLETCRPEIDPQVRFYRASLFINQWSYQKALPELRKYIRDHRTPTYSKLVGRLNLCASLVFIHNYPQAEQEISILLKKLEKAHLLLLKGNLLEIRSQLFIETNNFESALRDLDEAGVLLQRADPRTLLYVNKWKEIIKLKIEGPDKYNPLLFKRIRDRATAIQDWETLRHCDLAWAIATHDTDLLLRVYWGSLFPDYKKHVLFLFQDRVKIAPKFNWIFGSGNLDNPQLDLVELAPTRTLRKLFYFLTRDFYRPLRVTELIDFIYSDEFYNQTTSPQKLHRLIARARIWLKDSQLPFKIDSHLNAFKLESLTDCSLLLKNEFTEESPTIEIPAEFTERTFSSQEWAKTHRVSNRTARRQLLHLLEKGLLSKISFGSQTRYQTIN